MVEYIGDPLFPPSPTLALGATTAKAGATVSVSDAAAATTYWWLATLDSLESLLGGGSSPTPTIVVTLQKGNWALTAANSVSVAPAVYKDGVLTPPKLSGGFTVPAGVVKGLKYTVTVSYFATILGFSLANAVSAHLTVRG